MRETGEENQSVRNHCEYKKDCHIYWLGEDDGDVIGIAEYIEHLVERRDMERGKIMSENKKVFENAVYEQQRLNIERLAKERPDNWFYKAEMERPPERRTGFAPLDRRCWKCGKDITQGEKGITLESLGNYIITGCPHCNKSFCD